MFDDCKSIQDLQREKFAIMHAKDNKYTIEEINSAYMKARARIVRQSNYKQVPIEYCPNSVPADGAHYEAFKLIRGQVKSNQIKISSTGVIYV